MRMRVLLSKEISEKEIFLQSNFVGALDFPTKAAFINSDVVTVAGWIIPKAEGGTFKLRIKCSGCEPVDYVPNTPRPDVTQKLGARPLSGDNIFKGFRYEVPLSDEIQICVVINAREILWKSFYAIEVDVDAREGFRHALTNGYTEDNRILRFQLADCETRKKFVDSEFALVEMLDPQSAEKSLKISSCELEFFLKFTDEIGSPEFLSSLLSHRDSAGRIDIPAPFSDSRAVLVGSFFFEINYLVFECEGKRFYIGQYLHTADFVYFPDRSISLRVPWSTYDHKHVKSLLSSIAERPDLFPANLGRKDVVEVDVIINGVSPYHFFYDSIPALHIANRNGYFGKVRTFYVLNGGCYFPLEKLYDTRAKLQVVSLRQMSEISGDMSSTVFIVAGVSYKTFDAKLLEQMDVEIVEVAKVTGATSTVKAMLEELGGRFPVFWVGISAQKRAWVNQETALLQTLREIYRLYPKMAIVFDGMTASIFGISNGQAQFDADREIIHRLSEQLPPEVSTINLVGCNSAEKLCICTAIEFFIANYSTGSMYPARFHHLPGVAHLSNALFKAVKDIHIHHDTSVVPLDLVEDIPDQECPRLDFVSYSIDETAFTKFVVDAIDDWLTSDATRSN